MTKTIVLTDLVVTSLVLDYERQVVIANYKNVDAGGKQYEIGAAYFWATMPDPGRDMNGNPIPIPDNWFTLPPGYFPTLVQLRNDADAALTARFLV